MNTFIQWQETISDAYLTYTPSYFPLIEPNTSLLPQGSLASIPSNALIKAMIKSMYHLIFWRKHELNAVSLTGTYSFPPSGKVIHLGFQLHTLGSEKFKW